MSNREFQEWYLYEQLQPFGEKREDLRAGIIWQLFATVYGKKGASPVNVEDYPLLKASKTPIEEAHELHAKFLMFKKRYESNGGNA